MVPVALLALLSAATAPERAAPATPASPNADALFAEKVRPILEARCFKCHSQEAGKSKGGLRVDSRDLLIKGGGTGPALVPGHAKDSLLLTAIGYRDPELEMPPDEKMPQAEIDLLTRWVDLGAPWPAAAASAPKRKGKTITDADRAWWAFQPVREPRASANSPDNRIDELVRRELRTHGLTPTVAADRRTLIRRLTFDLHGLPPSPVDVDAFVNDRAPDAAARLIDRLMDSPRYGERWARYWLDLVRYAESDGYRQDAFRPDTWPYRDYVIRSFNDDKPYDRFVLEQLAGDEVAPDDPEALVATGFLRFGSYEWNQRDVRTQWTQILDEITDVTGDVFLGMGFQCARCHDHKFDPILQKDYYRLRAFFAPLAWRDDLLLARPTEREAYLAARGTWEEKTAAVREQLAAIEKPFLDRATRNSINMFPPDVQDILRRGLPEWDGRAKFLGIDATPTVAASRLSPAEWQLYRLAWRQVELARASIDGRIRGAERKRWSELKGSLRALGAPPVSPPSAFIATDVGPAASPTLIPGDKSGQAIEPGFLTVLDPAPAAVTPTDEAPHSTGRRAALARWIGSPDNPLAARVMVNRIWQRLFGRGLVRTSSDFGHLGEPPSHPELLDWLTARFIAGGMRTKTIEKLILASATYQQATAHARERTARRIDPDNRWLWHHAVRRLEAEEVRDTLLATSGELDGSAGGPSVDPMTPRRTLYTTALRNSRDPLLAAFDAPDGIASTPARNSTTTAAQALYLLNSRWVGARAQGFAARLAGTTSDDGQRIGQAYRLAFGRPPSPVESRTARTFLRRSAVAADAGTPDDVLTETMPHRGGKALRVRPERAEDRWESVGVAVPGDTVSLEAVALLDGIADDATARMVAAVEPTDPKGTGFMLGVAGATHDAGAGNLMVRIRRSNDEQQHFIGSDLHLELHRPYYIAVSLSPAPEAEGSIAATFYVQDLSDPEATLKTARAVKRMSAGAPWDGRVFVGGSGDGNGWDGLIDEVRLSARLDANELLVADGARMPAHVIGVATFEPDAANAASPHALKPVRAAGGKSLPSGWVDLCHALLNTNELFFLE